ncbi:type II toxin-antitoxin system PemK/MazF family toxin [Deinococcus sp.]|uniref:type II toxin-antitoxin system PemK/MazF family toxin n=1 Tax=Deinococcus sp. TaxID=47478 RepID=UPI00391D5F88
MLEVDFAAQHPSGNEQSGFRPAIIVAVPDFLAPPRFPGLMVVPFTSQVEKFRDLSEALYSMYASGSGGLTRDSIALIDQVRYVDQARITGRLGRFTETEYQEFPGGARCAPGRYRAQPYMDFYRSEQHSSRLDPLHPVPHDIRRLSPFRTSTGRCPYPGCSG